MCEEMGSNLQLSVLSECILLCFLFNNLPASLTKHEPPGMFFELFATNWLDSFGNEADGVRAAELSLQSVDNVFEEL